MNSLPSDSVVDQWVKYFDLIRECLRWGKVDHFFLVMSRFGGYS